MLKNKNKYLATILGFFGPFGTLYFGWRVMLSNLIWFFLVNTIALLLLREKIPYWGQYITAIFFMIWSWIYTDLYNSNDEENKSAFMILSVIYYASIFCTYIGLVICYRFYQEGKYIRIVIYALFGIPLSIKIINFSASFILGAIAATITKK